MCWAAADRMARVAARFQRDVLDLHLQVFLEHRQADDTTPDMKPLEGANK